MPAVANMQVPLSFLLAGYMLHELQQRSATSQHSAAYAVLATSHASDLMHPVCSQHLKPSPAAFMIRLQ